MEVSETSMKILGKELPWAPKRLEWFKATNYRVEIIDLDTLALKHNSSSYHNELIVFYDEDGKFIAQVGREEVNRPRLTLKPPFVKMAKIWRWMKTETIEQALVRLSPKSDCVRYIVHGEMGKYITIEKVPSRIPSLKLWLENKEREEARKLHEKLTE